MNVSVTAYGHDGIGVKYAEVVDDDTGEVYYTTDEKPSVSGALEDAKAFFLGRDDMDSMTYRRHRTDLEQNTVGKSTARSDKYGMAYVDGYLRQVEKKKGENP